MSEWRKEPTNPHGVRIITPDQAQADAGAIGDAVVRGLWDRIPGWVKGALAVGALGSGGGAAVMQFVPFETKEVVAERVGRLEAVDAGLQAQIDVLRSELPKAIAKEVVREIEAAKNPRRRR